MREAILLELCTGGIVFLPGSAGTVQEIFQDACENYYGAPETITPMVLVGREHWEDTYPAWPMMQALAAGKAMAGRIHLVDTVEEASPSWRSRPPVAPRAPVLPAHGHVRSRLRPVDISRICPPAAVKEGHVPVDQASTMLCSGPKPNLVMFSTESSPITKMSCSR